MMKITLMLTTAGTTQRSNSNLTTLDKTLRIRVREERRHNQRRRVKRAEGTAASRQGQQVAAIGGVRRDVAAPHHHHRLRNSRTTFRNTSEAR